jgi:hypothetical protein
LLYALDDHVWGMKITTFVLIMMLHLLVKL